MTHVFRAQRTFVGLFTLGLFATLACSEGKRGPFASSNEFVNNGGDPCSSPNAGCECSDDGAIVACGEVKRISGDYISCSMGKRTCSAGSWGPCIGDAITTRSASSLSTQGLGSQTKCTGNPCAPDCVNQTDTPPGIDAGAGFKISDAGLSLEGVTVDGGSACATLTVSPSPTTTLTVTNLGASNTVAFTPSLLPAGCYVGPVPALWAVDKFDISSINPSGLLTLVTPIAGPIQVQAFAGTLASAPTTVNVVVNAVDVSAAPAGVTAAMLTGAGAAPDPIEILYPYTGTMFPLGLPAPILQWRNGGTPATAVRVTLRYPATGTPIFSWSGIINESTTFPATAIAAQPRAAFPQQVWFAFEQTAKRNRVSLGDAAALVIQRLVGGVLRNEVSRSIRFADGQLKGKIFYNSYGTNLALNYPGAYTGARFGAATLGIAPGATTPTVVAGYSSNPGTDGCRVCHSVAAQGNVLATCYESHAGVSYNLAASPVTQTPIGSAAIYGFPALSPDGSYLFTGTDIPGAYGATSGLYLLNGNPVPSGTVFTNLRAGTPAFSHDASKLAFVFRGNSIAPVAAPTTGPVNGDGKTLSTMDFNPVTKTFSNMQNRYTPALGSSVWPSFLPPGQNGIVFEREIITNQNGGWGFTRSNCDARDAACNDTGTTGELMWVNTIGAPQPVVLAKANGVGLPTGPNLHGTGAAYAGTAPTGHAITVANFNDAVYNYEPTALPISAGGYSWIAFTSRRMYGNIATINPYYSDPRFRNISAEPTPKKVWITAIANNPTPGTDPSFPAFYLPGQELLAGNSRAYFALEACKVPNVVASATNLCETDLDCCGGTATPQTAICKIDTPIASPPTKHCVPTGGGMCSADGGACALDSNCCGFATGTRCASGVCQTPPPIVNYSAASYVRDYVSNCPVGKRPVWRFFDWQSITPTGTSISFLAATGATVAALGPQVAVGVAQPLPVVTPTWTSAPFTVDTALTSTGQVSKVVLRITAVFNPKTVQPSATPTLTQWRQNYDCVDSE
jgi:hypothetical protein